MKKIFKSLVTGAGMLYVEKPVEPSQPGPLRVLEMTISRLQDEPMAFELYDESQVTLLACHQIRH